MQQATGHKPGLENRLRKEGRGAGAAGAKVAVPHLTNCGPRGGRENRHFVTVPPPPPVGNPHDIGGEITRGGGGG